MSTHISTAKFTKKHGNFSISEFCITGQPPYQGVASAIMEYHIVPMNAVRELYKAPISVSKSSGYRPRSYEQSRGRSGNSQHSFEDINPKGIGAADYTGHDIDLLLKLIIENTEYTRICIYPNNGFIHCDYKPVKNIERAVFTATSPQAPWKLKKIIK
jgi:hypothetical protein